MLFEFATSYAVVILAMVLSVGAINIYYFVDLILQKENREKLYTVWILALASLAVHSSGHLIEAAIGNIMLYRTLEVASLFTSSIALGIMAKNTLSFYAFVETRKRMEEAVQERTNALEEKVKELENMRAAILNMLDDVGASHEELKAAYDELKGLDKMKDEFLSNVSHELRTPLTIIKGSLDLLGEGEISKEQTDLVSMAKQNTNRLNALIGDILYYAKMEYGEEPIIIEKFDLGEVVESSVKLIMPMAKNNDITIETNASGDLGVSGDKSGMYKVFSNLLSNAIKFNKKGGRVSVNATGIEDGRIKVTIWDTGIGIPKERLNKIFTRFYQVDGSTKRKYPGTGLGLAMVKTIVEKHGGKIWVESEMGKGTKFIFEIPKVNAAVG